VGTPPHLAVEFYRAFLALEPGGDAWNELRRLGVPLAGEIAAGGVGIATVETTGNSFYQPAPGSRLAFIMPCYGPYPPPKMPTGPGDPQPHDLLAWCPNQPSRWWLRRGSAVTLGEWAVALAETYREPLHVHQTPLDWLQHGGGGAVVLDAEAAAYRLRDIPLVAEDENHAADLHRKLTIPAVVPTVLVPRRRAA
jgi:hypothetical protein